ncbi:hypothetical protein F0562_010367 [Nyssa sinensis]|uniref:Uncharacterized protein n=1 Tax=Nyssa sinensis TaxID=561372 RepID=A0A5J5A1A4_9ASTE|nr:hypothetical protein F0562_010367 [Nyssa sinensis]
MDHINESFGSSSSSTTNERVEDPEDLLEDCWFFRNLLDTRPKMLRSYSDPCPSSNSYARNASSSLNKLPEEKVEEKERGNGANMSNSTPQAPRHNLLRSPSLPPWMGREETLQDAESDFTMGKLIRQASLNPEDMLPPRHASKGITKGSSITRHRPRRKPELESINMDGSKETRSRYPINQLITRKSLSDLEIEEVQGFRDLGFTFNKEDLNTSVVNILPGLQEKNREDSDEEQVKRPYLSEAWLAQSSAPPIPNWVDKRSAEDMKAQIKFWARVVASNVR